MKQLDLRAMTDHASFAAAGKAVTLRLALREATEFLSRMGVEGAGLDAEVLLTKALGIQREKLYLDYNARLSRDAIEQYCSLLLRRARREPVAYIIGEREFWSLDFVVTQDVLVPRPETERVVEVALEYLEKFRISKSEIRILDIGTGCGAIAVSLAKELSDAALWAIDLSSTSLSIARINALRHGVEDKIRFLEGDMFKPIEDRRGFFHMIVSNPPYVRRDEIAHLPPEVRDWEPRIALDGGLDGLDFYREIAREGCHFLKSGGLMVLEIGAGMGTQVSQIFEAIGCYAPTHLHRDYDGRDRVVLLRKLPSPSGLPIFDFQSEI